MLLSFLLFILTPLQLAAQPHPDFTGTWKLNESTSGSQTTGVHGTVFKIQHKDPHFSYSAAGMRGPMPFSEAYEFTTDGKSPTDPSKVCVVASWESGGLAMRYYRGGKELAKFVLRLSADGKQMTREADLSHNRKVRETYNRQ